MNTKYYTETLLEVSSNKSSRNNAATVAGVHSNRSGPADAAWASADGGAAPGTAPSMGWSHVTEELGPLVLAAGRQAWTRDVRTAIVGPSRDSASPA